MERDCWGQAIDKVAGGASGTSRYAMPGRGYRVHTDVLATIATRDIAATAARLLLDDSWSGALR